MADDQESRNVYCLADRELLNDPEQGSLIPIAEKTINGCISVDVSSFPNNGKIHVTRGYHDKFTTHPRETVFLVGSSISTAWNPEDAHDGISKYVTYYRNAEAANPLQIALVIESDYPDPSQLGGMKAKSPFLPVDLFFIRCVSPERKNVIIGPLSIIKGTEIEENGFYTFDYNAPNRPFGNDWTKINQAPHSTMLFEMDLISEDSIITSLGREYLVNTEQLPFLSSFLIDLSTDENILKWAAKLIRQSGNSSKANLSAFKDVINAIPEDIDLPADIYNSRRSRLTKIQDRLSKVDGFSQIIADYMKSIEGRDAIKQHVEANRNSLLEMYLEEALEKEVDAAKERASREISEINIEIKGLRGQELELRKTLETLRNSEAGFQVESLKKEIEKLRDEKNLIDSVDELKIRKKILEDDTRALEAQRNQAQTLLSEIQASIGSTEESHKLKLIELKMGLEAISGNVKSQSDLKAEILLDKEFKKINATSPNDARKEIVNSLTRALEDRGRITDDDEVAVLLTSIVQNLIVTLAGKPGVGKSSTVTELSAVLGLQNKNRYVRIQVQRGWTSDRDLLGFYNKLSHYYDPDRFGLYKLINGLQEVPMEHQFSFALLDEANLSPIEHYWSGFMGACDDLNSFSTQGETLKLPSGLRFISTVNYDRTTEPLSARFIDRSPVIYLENKRGSFIADQQVSISKDELQTCNYSFENINHLFGKSDEASFTSDEARIVEQIIEDFDFLSIKHRKINSMRFFTHTLRGVVSSESTDILKALDYAILIHILPMVNGQGRYYSKSLKIFNEYLQHQGLMKSAERLKHIIENNQFDTYSYFS